MVFTGRDQARLDAIAAETGAHAVRANDALDGEERGTLETRAPRWAAWTC